MSSCISVYFLTKARKWSTPSALSFSVVIVYFRSATRLSRVCCSANILEDYNDHIFQVIDMFPDFRMRLKLDKKTGKVMYGTDIQSVFDICWYTFSRMVADVAPPVDEDLNYFEAQGTILSCLACGKYFVRHSSRQLYCDSWDCQAERNRRNRRASYARKKAAEAENKE